MISIGLMFLVSEDIPMIAKLSSDLPVPLYRQVANDLRSAIENNVYRIGGKIPPEPELSQLYSVSRITVRKAIEILVNEGYLKKCQGKGTYVCGQSSRSVIQDDRSEAVNGFTESCRRNGLEPGAHLLCREIMAVPQDERSFFGESESDKVIRIDRIRTADGEPLMVEFNMFPLGGLEFLATADLEDTSLFELIERHTSRHACRNSSQTLNIRLAEENLSKLLSVPVGEPLFYLEGRYRDQFGDPLYFGRQYIIGSRYMFSM